MTTQQTRNSEQYIDDYCKRKGLRFTEQRRAVYRIIQNTNRPIGAYDIRDKLAEQYDNPKATTVYRALEFLLAHHFIHKIESLNAFVVCDVDHEHSGSQFMICQECGMVDEVHLCHLPPDLKARLTASQFSMSYWNTEIHGLCQSCQTRTR